MAYCDSTWISQRKSALSGCPNVIGIRNGTSASVSAVLDVDMHLALTVGTRAVLSLTYTQLSAQTI